MPVVPSYGVPSVTPEALPGARLTAGADARAFGAGAAAGAGDVAAAGASIIERERARQRQVRLQDWSNRLAERENQLLYDPNTGAFQKRGKDAFGTVDPTLKNLDEFAGDLQKETQDGTEQEQLRQLVDERRAGVERSLMNHVGREMQSFDETSFAAAQSSSRNAALENYQDPHRVDEEAYRQLGAIEGYAQRNGLPPEWVQDQQAKAQSATYAGAIGRMLDAGDELAAKDALKRWGGALTGEDGARIDGAMKETSSRAEARTLADDITKDAPDLSTALTKLDERKLPADKTDVYDKARDRIVSHFRLKKEAEVDADLRLFQGATDAIDAAKPGQTADEVVPPTTWNALRPSLRQQLRSYARSKATGVPIETDWGVYTQLRDQARTNPQAFLDQPMIEYRGVLGDPEYRELLNLRDTVAGKDNAAGKKAFARLTTTEQVVEETLAKVGIDARPVIKGVRNEDAIAFRYQLEKHLDAQRQLTGQEANTEDVRKIAEGMIVQQAVGSGKPTFGSRLLHHPLSGGLRPGDTEAQATKYAFQVPYANDIAYTVDQIPSGALDSLLKDAAAEGVREPSDEYLVNTYNALLREGQLDGQ